MAIDTMDKLVAALPGQHRHIYKATVGSEGAGTWSSLWKVAGLPGAGATPPPGDGEIPIYATAGAIPITAPGPGRKLYLGRFSAAGSILGTLILYDRLWHNSGFSGNITTPQTIATPPTLTRPDSSGDDVELWLQVYSAMGATASTFVAIYTNSDGIEGRSATYSMPANALTVGQVCPFTLQAGDTGVRTVSQVQLSAPTGGDGDFGLLLLRRIAEVPISSVNVLADRDAFALGMPEIHPLACLTLHVMCTSTSTGNIMAAVEFIEG